MAPSRPGPFRAASQGPVVPSTGCSATTSSEPAITQPNQLIPLPFPSPELLLQVATLQMTFWIILEVMALQEGRGAPRHVRQALCPPRPQPAASDAAPPC